MIHRHTRLPNGLHVVTGSMADAYSATVSVFAGVGSRYEDFPTQGGVSHFLEHLLFKGTKRRPSAKLISEEIDAVGGWNNAYTTSELTTFYVKVPYQHAELGLDILADMVREPLLDPEEIDRERNVIVEEMNLYLDDPAVYVHRLTPPLLWPDHPLANDVLGSAKVVTTIPREEIANYLRRYYVPNNMVVTVVGRVEHDEVVKQVDRLFGDMKEGERHRAEAVEHVLGSDRTAVHSKDTAQAHIAISSLAYPYLHPDDPAAKLITTILGRGLSSRLFLNVRERKGLAYSVSAGMENYVDTGEFEVYAGVNLEKQSEAIAAIIEELATVASKPVGKEELAKAKNQIRGGLQMAMESGSAVADRFGTQQILLGQIRTVEETLKEIDAVSPNDIQRVATEMLSPQRLRLGIISPKPDAAVETFTKLTT